MDSSCRWDFLVGWIVVEEPEHEPGDDQMTKKPNLQAAASMRRGLHHLQSRELPVRTQES